MAALNERKESEIKSIAESAAIDTNYNPNKISEARAIAGSNPDLTKLVDIIVRKENDQQILSQKSDVVSKVSDITPSTKVAGVVASLDQSSRYDLSLIMGGLDGVPRVTGTSDAVRQAAEVENAKKLATEANKGTGRFQ